VSASCASEVKFQFKSDVILGGDYSPYLEYKAKKLLKSKIKDISDTELFCNQSKIDLCGVYAMRNTITDAKGSAEYQKGDDIYQKIRCGKPNCPECGVRGGYIEKRRKKRMKDILNRKYEIKDMSFQSLVFTVPADARVELLSRYRINDFMHLTKKVVESEFPDVDRFAVFHAFGDREPGVFKPHNNEVIVRRRGEILRLSLEKLESIKARYRAGLSILLARDVGLVDVHYSFKITDKAVCHHIKYLCRPVPSYDDFECMSRLNKKLFIINMRGFQYVRYSKSWGKISAELEPIVSEWSGSGVEYVSKFVKFSESKIYKEYEKRELSPGVVHCRPGGFGFEPGISKGG
jgi:hypothetical protein